MPEIGRPEQFWTIVLSRGFAGGNGGCARQHGRFIVNDELPVWVEVPGGYATGEYGPVLIVLHGIDGRGAIESLDQLSAIVWNPDLHGPHALLLVDGPRDGVAERIETVALLG